MFEIVNDDGRQTTGGRTPDQGYTTAAFTYYYDPAILQNKLTPLSIFRDLALRKGDLKMFIFHF